MLEVGNKYNFKIINRVNNGHSLEIEDPFGNLHLIPLIQGKDSIELKVININGNRKIFSQESCEKTKLKLNEEVTLSIKKAEEIGDNRIKIFVYDSIGRVFNFFVPKPVYEKVKLLNVISCKPINILGERIHFRSTENVHYDYKYNQIYELEILRIQEIKKDERFIYSIVGKGIYGDAISVLARKWQFFHKEKIKSVFVRLENESQDRMTFIQDYEKAIHPFFVYGNEYEFKIIKFENEESERVILRGLDGCTYIAYLPFNLEMSLTNSDKSIKYIYKGLKPDSGNPRLKCFIQFEDIIKNYRALKRLTFDSIYKDNQSQDVLVKKFISDYDDFQNLWIISFCEILRDKIKVTISNGDFDSSLIFIDVLIQTEKWIIESGFLSTFTESRKIETEKTANNEISKFSKIAKALEILLDKKDIAFIDSLIILLKDNDFQKFNNEIDLGVQVFWYQQIHSEIDLTRLFNLVYLIGLKKEDYFQNIVGSNALLSLLEKLRADLEKILLSRVFISSKERNKFYTNNEKLRALIQVNIIQAKVYFITKKKEDLHLSISRIFKLYSFYSSDYSIQIKSISIAIGLMQSQIGKKFSEDHLNLVWEHVLDIELFFKSNLGLESPKKSLVNLEILQSSLKNISVLKGAVIDKNELGFLINFDKDILILPYYTTTRIFYANEEIEFVVKNIDEKFSTVFISENKKLIGDDIITNIEELNIGDIIRGKVKHIENKFVWISLGLVDGRMPINEISKQFVQHPSAILKIGQIIDVKVMAIEERDGIKYCKLSRKAILEEKTQSLINQQGKEFISTITNINNEHGLFVELDYGDSCIIPRRNIAWNPAFDINEIFDIGEKISVKIIGVTGDGHIRASALVSKDPFEYDVATRNKEYEAKIFSIYDFYYWAQKYEIVLNETDEDEFYFCPKCSKHSIYHLKNLKFPLSSTKTLKVKKGLGYWECSYCNWSGEDLIMVWIPSINCTASFRLLNIPEDKRSLYLSKIEHGDYCSVFITKVNKRNGYIYVDIVPESFRHKARIISSSEYNQFILNEIANCFEHFAFLSNDYKERINYLNFSRYYYGAAYNAKSYYLKAYVEFTDIVYSFESKELNSIEDKIIEKVTKLITQIESEELSVEVFPIIETIVKILKILRLYKTTHKDDLYYLLKNSIEVNTTFSSISSLSKIILSQSLLSEEDSAFLKDNLDSRIIKLLRETLTFFEYVEIEEEDILRQKLIYRLMLKGENIDTEFKASLDVPVLSKNTKREIIKLQHELIKSKQFNDIVTFNDIQDKIQSLNKIDIGDKRIIKEINMSVIKTLAAFTNTSGGYLLIGVDEDENDNPYIIGLNFDLAKYKNKDGLKLKFDSLIQVHLGDSFNQYIDDFSFISLGDKEVLLIKVGISEKEPVFLKKSDGESIFFIRRQASTVSLSTEEQFKYFMKRFKG